MTEPNGLNTKLAAVLSDLTTALSGLAEIVADLNGMRGADLTSVLNDLSSIVSDLNGIRGADNLGLGDLNSNLAAIRSATGDTRASLDSLSTGLFDTMGLREGEDGLTLWQLMSGLYNNVGQTTGDATTSVLGRLAAIERLLKCNCPPEGPDLTDPDVPCSEPYTSNPLKTRTTSLYPGRIFAGWNEPPADGLSMDSFLEVPVAPCELNRASDELGYKIYVQSQAPLASLNPLFPNLARTNEWIDLLLYNENIAVSVPEGNDLTVYICVPMGDVWTDCVTLDSILATYNTNQPFSMAVQTIVLSSIPNQTLANTWNTGATEHSISVFETVVLEDWIGVRITLTAGDSTRVTYLDSAGSMDGVNITSIGDSFTLPLHTTMVTITNFATSNPSEHPFSVEICPPEPG